jgi:hypothetical protein
MNESTVFVKLASSIQRPLPLMQLGQGGVGLVMR